MDNNMKNAIPQLGQDIIEAFAELLGETAEELISEISNREKKFSDLDENSICVPYYIAKEACDIIIPFMPKNVVLDLYPRVIQLPVPVIDIRKWYDDSEHLEKVTNLSRAQLSQIIYCNAVMRIGEDGRIVEGVIDDRSAGNINSVCYGASAIRNLLKQKLSALSFADKSYFISYIPIVFPLNTDKSRGYAFRCFYSHLSRITSRASRLKRLCKLNAPTILILNEVRMLQEAVDDFLVNGKRESPLCWAETGNKVIGVHELEEVL